MRKLLILLLVGASLYATHQGTIDGSGTTKVKAKKSAMGGVKSMCRAYGTNGYLGTGEYEVLDVMFEKDGHMWTCLIEYRCK